MHPFLHSIAMPPAGANATETQQALDGKLSNDSGTIETDGSGNITAGGYAGDGSNITGLNASLIASGTVPSARGGAGAVSGILKADGSGVVSAAVAGTDYISPASPTFTGGFSSTSAVTITGATTLTGTNYIVRCNAASAGFTVSLPAAASNNGRFYIVKKIDTTGNVVTLDANASELIDGAVTQSLDTAYEIVTLYCNGTSWDIL